MLLRIFAVLLLANLAGQVVQAKADDELFAWQSGYNASLTQAADVDSTDELEAGDCIGRAIAMVINRFVFNEQDASAQNLNSSASRTRTSYAMELEEDEITLNLAWTF